MLAVSAGHLLKIAFDGLLVILVTGFALWVFIRTLKKSEDPPALIFKWILTLVLLGFWLAVAVPDMGPGGMSAFIGVCISMVEGIILAIIWRRNIAGLVADPLGGLYDGGTTPQEAKPFYSSAIAQRKRGNYNEAFAGVRKELEKFPTDLEGLLLLADLQAENLNDLPGATVTIERICNQPEHTPGNVALALNILADWYLKLNQDRDAARETLQRIIDRFPESEMAVLASQRIASLASTEHLLAAHNRKKFAVVEGVQNLGLLDPKFHPAPADPDAAKQAAELVEHLQAHPLDAESREKLAVIYADHYDRMDLATDQLEQLITYPSQPSKRVVHWLNLLADLQIRHAAKYEAVRPTLQRIIDLFPNSPTAELAANRIIYLKLELKGKEKSQPVKLGSYEQDIGLKQEHK
jgi:outer membrane protein assembly factor BamD (BamD/ComL family)